MRVIILPTSSTMTDASDGRISLMEYQVLLALADMERARVRGRAAVLVAVMTTT